MVLLRREIGGGVGLCDGAEEQEVGGEVGGPPTRRGRWIIMRWCSGAR